MSNFTHFNVLLRKNFLTLKRKWGFALFFILLPIISMSIFAGILSAISEGSAEEGHNFDKLFFTSTRTITKSSEATFSDTDIGIFNYSSLANCKYNSLDNYALIGSDEDIAKFAATEAILKQFEFTGYHYSNRDAIFEIVSTEQTDTFCFGLQIDKFDTVEDDYEFQVMWLHQNIPDTNNNPYDLNIKTPDFDNYNKYKNSGFLGIYQVIIDAILKNKGKTETIDVAYMPIKTPTYQALNPLVTAQLSQQFPFFIMFTFLIPLYYIVSKLAEEKESKSREGMKMMGLKDTSYFMSWFVFFVIIVIVMSGLITIMVSFNVFPQSNKLLIFLMCMFYGISLFGFSTVIVAILPSVRSSATAASLLHIVTYFVIFAISDPSLPSALKIGLSIFPNIGMCFCVFNLYHFESDSTGLTYESASFWYGNITFWAALIMLLVDVALYLFLGIYLDQILQSQFGVPKKWYFLCTRKFCCAQKKQRQNRETGERDESLLKSIQGEDENDYEKIHYNDFEQVPESLRKQEQSKECLQIKGLRRTFGDKVAVDNSNVTMYNGQIFALLGHNGAGKTTTISMLTGLLQATKGNASAFGLDIFEEMDEFRKILGVCPQHDVLFEYLTCKEHLELFAAFKGTPKNEIQEVVEKMILDIDLVSVRDQLAGTLSGGQKRKLSVGIAMIGKSKIVILDEPSSGMDTSSRRRLWEMLKQNKNGRIVILTTHYMDEADILGDRICIMGDGKIKCCGSSLFLKNRYGVGYNLVIAKKSRDPAPQIDQFVNNYIEKVKKLQEVSSEISFQLPTESASQFKNFFNQLDANLDQLGIRSYGVGITTLEEVFLKIGKGEEELEDDADDEELKKFTLEKFKNTGGNSASAKELESQNVNDEYSIAEQHEVGTSRVFFLHLRALLYKKFFLQIRDPRTCIIEILFPIIFIFVGLALSQVRIFTDGGPRLLSPSIFPQPSPLFYNDPISLGVGDATTFVTNYFTEDFWDAPRKVAITNTGDYVSMVSEFDDEMYKESEANKLPNPIYGNFFIYSLNGKGDGNYAAFVLANVTSQDAVAVYGAYVHEVLLRQILGNTKLKLKVTDQPFPLTVLEQGVVNAATGTAVSILFAVAYMMVSDSLIQNIIRERQKNVKHQMIISGISLPAYWVSHYLLDIIFQAPPSICAIFGIWAFGLDFPQGWVIILVFIFANPVFVYAFSCLFSNDSSASITIRLSYVLMGSILPIAIQVLLVIESTAQIGQIIRWFFYLLPVYSLNIGLSNIADRQVMAVVQHREILDPLSFDVGGPSVLFLVIDIFVYWALIILYEKKIVQRFFRRTPNNNTSNQDSFTESHFVDEDIIEEEKRVELADPRGLTVKLHQVEKSYGKTLAVDKASFGLEYGECFALLGVSGAGKTTVFKCLTGEEVPSRGQVSVNGFDVTTSAGFDQARRLIGYCPQFDAIFDRLTVREHLEFYSKVKGILEQVRQQIVETTLDEMDLREFQNVRAENLSGGNKRKLSVAMAIIGNPPIIFLDEPSTGVDPKAKRFMWTIVSKISTQRKKSSVIITTHSMEEAEALCTKMGIMVAGKFKCFGSSQHIKTKYGTGYELEVKIKYLREEDLNEVKEGLNLGDLNQRINAREAEDILMKFDAMHLSGEISKTGAGQEFYTEFNSTKGTTDIDEFIRWVFTESRGGQLIEKLESIFTTVEVLEHYSTSFKFKVSRDTYSIGYLFGMMEDLRPEYSISEYSVSQTSLEQIFNNFAKEAEKGNARKRTTVVRKSVKNAPQQKLLGAATDKQTLTFKLKTERMNTEALDKTN